jgi:UDP-N-acetylglucosamine acyltransferase
MVFLSEVISTAFRLLRQNESIEYLQDTEEIKYLKQWLAVKSKRGGI